jgi:hypothetical protein
VSLTLCRVRLGQFRWYPMGRRIAAVDPVLCNPCVTQSRVRTHWSGAQYPRDVLFKGRNIQELSVGDTSTLHPLVQIYKRVPQCTHVPSLELGLSHPLSRQRVCPSPRDNSIEPLDFLNLISKVPLFCEVCKLTSHINIILEGN